MVAQSNLSSVRLVYVSRLLCSSAGTVRGDGSGDPDFDERRAATYGVSFQPLYHLLSDTDFHCFSGWRGQSSCFHSLTKMSHVFSHAG